jgi:lysozyme family protein
MSNFDTAVITVLKHEGGFVDDPKDPGGATNFGISLGFLKKIGELDLNGLLHGDFDHDGEITAEDIKAMTREQAIELYRAHWWDKYQYERIVSQQIATKVLSLSVNMGGPQAHKCLQRAIRAVSGHLLLEDGIIGPKSIVEVNNLNANELLASYRSEAAGFYRSLNKPRYINGWLSRAYD